MSPEQMKNKQPVEKVKKVGKWKIAAREHITKGQKEGKSTGKSERQTK